MDLLYAILILLLTLIEDLESAFQTKAVINSFANEKVLFESDEPSLLQCAQRCRFIDKNAIIDFKGSKCTCLKYDADEGQEQIGTLTGVFINQKVMQMEPKPKPIDGGLSDWMNETSCTVTCGEGTLNQTKTCTNPAPRNGGKDCASKPRRTVTCNKQDCPCVKTTDGSCCNFPFEFKGKKYDKCVMLGNNYFCLGDVGTGVNPPLKICAKPPN